MEKIEHIKNKQTIEEKYFVDCFADLQPYVIKPNYKYTNLTAPYDVKFQSGSTYCIGEVKVRDKYDNNFFVINKPFLELKKIEGMYKQKKLIKDVVNVDVQMVYLNFAKDAVQVFLLNEPHQYNFHWEYLPIDSYTPHIKEWKLVTKLSNPIQTISYE